MAKVALADLCSQLVRIDNSKDRELLLTVFWRIPAGRKYVSRQHDKLKVVVDDILVDSCS